MSGAAANGAPKRRRQLWLSALLMGLCWLQLQRVSDRLPTNRGDWSEDRLASFSPAAEKILSEVDGSVVLEAFLTLDSQSGSVVVLMRRMQDQLDELKRLGGGKVTVSISDPSRSSEALGRARSLGIEPQVGQLNTGTRTIQENIYLGLVVRHSGRARVFGEILPQSLEYRVLQAIDDLSAPRRSVIGWVQGEDLGAALQPARAWLQRRFDVRELRGLEAGVAVAEDVDLVVLAGPRDLHPRAAYEIERWTRAGGRLAVFADRTRFDSQLLVESIETGFGPQLKAFGLMPDRRLLWDREFGALAPGDYRWYPFPALLASADGSLGLAPEHPIGAAQPQIVLQLAHPLKGVPRDGAPVPEPFLTSSETAFLGLPPERLDLDPRALREELNTLLARQAPERFVLGATVVGELHEATPFDAAPVPAPLPGAPEPSDDAPRSERDLRGPVDTADARLLVIGDVDWLASRDGSALPPASRLLLENAVDWLGARPELIELRGKQPTPRPLRDFGREAREALDRDSVLAELTLAERRVIEASASRARWTTIGAAFAGSLAALVLLFAIQRRPRRARIELGPGPGGSA